MALLGLQCADSRFKSNNNIPSFIEQFGSLQTFLYSHHSYLVTSVYRFSLLQTCMLCLQNISFWKQRRWDNYTKFGEDLVFGPEEDKVLEPVNLVRRKYLLLWGSHRKYFQKWKHKLTSMPFCSFRSENWPLNIFLKMRILF